jgi:hypothetical protein
MMAYFAFVSFFGDDPHGMNDAGNIPEQRQHQVDPEVFTDPDLEKNPQRGQKNGEQDANQIHNQFLSQNNGVLSIPGFACRSAPMSDFEHTLEDPARGKR